MPSVPSSWNALPNRMVAWFIQSSHLEISRFYLIQLELEDCDMVAEKMVAEKAEVIIPIKDRPYGKREVRIRNPFGQLWILSQQVAG
jgi:uncharacterized glyoxalase superfamily protein PhnB